jgi:uncharacterized coiled-coil DUF342 family protein
MRSKASLKQKSEIVSIALLLAISLSLFNVIPALAHIPEGWVPIEECWKYVGGAAPGAAAADISVAAMYKAMNMAIDELWDGKPPRRSDIRIISKLPTAGAEHAGHCIVGMPEGEFPPKWKSDNPGEFEFVQIRGTEENNLSLENFKITIIRKSTGEEYTWRPGAGVFVGSYFKCRNREARGEETKWWQETECASVMGIPLSKLEESIGLMLANELHDDYAQPLNEDIVGKVDAEDTLLYLAAALAESGDKGELDALRENFEEASDLIGKMHDMVHDKIVPLAEEIGKGEYEVNILHGLAHGLMASIYKIGEYLDEIEKTNDVDEVREKANEMLDEAKRLSVLASEAHVHSIDPSIVLTEQKPLMLKDAGGVIEIEYEDLQRYYREMSGEGEEKEKSPLGGSVVLGIIIVGLASLWVVSRGSKRASLKQKTAIVSVVALLVISLSLFHATPAQAHIPEGWCPIEDCWKYVEGAASPGGAAAPDVSVAAMYRAMSMATDSLWGGRPPKRSDIEIISNLPTAGAQHAGHCIVGVPEGEAPSWWTSDKPGEFEIVPGIDEKNLKLEDFEIVIIRKSTGEQYTWKPDADTFPAGYFDYLAKEARDKRLMWWEESRIGDIKSKPVSKLEEPIGLMLVNKLHDDYAQPLDEGIIGKVDDEGSMLYLAAALAKSGDKGEAERLREKFEEALDLVNKIYDIAHDKLVPLVEEMGKGEDEVETIHNLALGLMASINKISNYMDEIEKTEDVDVDEVKEKASEMLDEVKKLSVIASEARAHSIDAATMFAGQEPLRLEEAGEVIEIEYKDLQRYHSEMSGEGEEKEQAPIGVAVACGVIVVGLVGLGVMRARRKQCKEGVIEMR